VATRAQTRDPLGRYGPLDRVRVQVDV
jgi:hypothetical protein